MHLTLRIAVMLLISGLLGMAARADTVYRWLDSQGHVHYSQSPPAGTAATVVKVVPAPAPTSVSPADRQSLEKFLHTQQAAQKRQAKVEQQEAKKLAQQQKRCAAARQHLKNFLTTHTVLPEADSNAIGDFQNDALIARQLQLQQQVSTACKSN